MPVSTWSRRSWNTSLGNTGSRSALAARVSASDRFLAGTLSDTLAPLALASMLSRASSARRRSSKAWRGSCFVPESIMVSSRSASRQRPERFCRLPHCRFSDRFTRSPFTLRGRMA